ncbi:unnamed protein product [Didymodactylos carnosus]|uniref:Uncharacterized protein n=1 Tax=Didymodactylos carnosus TaxID=1234261 RepID=A0A8S2CRU9_9BILA|nr:unnamed protein product [Didymodactylos carnosus]CAF3525774.1 unnamed protein product [Didymodactylos carnosus]
MQTVFACSDFMQKLEKIVVSSDAFQQYDVLVGITLIFIKQVINYSQGHGGLTKPKTTVSGNHIKTHINFLSSQSLGLIQKAGKPSCPLDYFDRILIPTLLQFIDIESKCITLLSCSICHRKSIIDQTFSNYLLVQTFCNGDVIDAALEKYFAPENDGKERTCSACLRKSDQHMCTRHVFTAPLQQILTNFQLKLATTRDSTFQLTNEPSLELQSAVRLLLRQNTMWDMNIKSLCWAVASNYICDTCGHGK